MMDELDCRSNRVADDDAANGVRMMDDAVAAEEREHDAERLGQASRLLLALLGLSTWTLEEDGPVANKGVDTGLLDRAVEHLIASGALERDVQSSELRLTERGAGSSALVLESLNYFERVLEQAREGR